MAFVVMQDGSTKTLSAEQGLAVWQVLNGEKKPENKQQDIFCCNVKRIYLNRHNAPESYLQRFPQGQDIETGKYATMMGAKNVQAQA